MCYTILNIPVITISKMLTNLEDGLKQSEIELLHTLIVKGTLMNGEYYENGRGDKYTTLFVMDLKDLFTVHLNVRL